MKNVANVAKGESFLNINPKSVDTKFELHCMNNFLCNGRKPPFSVIFWPLEGNNLVNVSLKQISPEHFSSKCTHQVWIELH